MVVPRAGHADVRMPPCHSGLPGEWHERAEAAVGVVLHEAVHLRVVPSDEGATQHTRLGQWRTGE